VSNIVTIDQSSTITIKQAPQGVDPEVAKSFFPEDGDQLTEWKDRFKRSKGIFNQGERVAVQATVERNELGNPYLRTAQASCSADRFNPVRLNAKSTTDLIRFVGATVTASVTVTQRTGRQFCHGSQYDIDTHIELALLPLNPTTEELLRLPSKSHVVIEGVVTNFVPYDEPEYTNGRVWHTNHYGRIYLSVEGRTIAVSQFKDALLYDKGELENLRDKEVLIGEKVRLTAMVTDDHKLQAGYNRPYLLVPDPARLEAYNELRNMVSNLLETLEATITNGQYQQARDRFGFLRQQKLTFDEAQTVVDCVQHLPEAEQPIFQKEQHYCAESLEEAFGVNVETLNKAQFIVFARQVLTGVRENPPREEARTDQTYLHRFMEEPRFTPTEQFELIKETLEARIPRLEQCSDEQNDYWDDSYLIESSLGYLARTGHPEAFDELGGIVEYCLEQGYFRHDEKSRDDTCPRRFDSLLSHALRAILELFREDPLLGVNSQHYVKAWQQELTDREATGYVLTEIQRLIPFSS
jgi:hypothetical protein